MSDRLSKSELNIEGSPRFEYSNPATSQNVRWSVDCELTSPTSGTASAVRKYLPFDWYKITNNSGQTIEFYRNMGSTPEYIYSGQVITVSSRSLFAFIIIPTSGDILADTVKVLAQRMEMTSDKFSRDLSKNVFIKGLLGV